MKNKVQIFYRISFQSVCYSIKSDELKFASQPYIYIIRNIPYINKKKKREKLRKFI